MRGSGLHPRKASHTVFAHIPPAAGYMRHPRYYWRLVAESHLRRRLFGAMLGRIAAIFGPACGPAKSAGANSPSAGALLVFLFHYSFFVTVTVIGAEVELS